MNRLKQLFEFLCYSEILEYSRANGLKNTLSTYKITHKEFMGMLEDCSRFTPRPGSKQDRSRNSDHISYEVAELLRLINPNSKQLKTFKNWENKSGLLQKRAS